MQLIEIQRTEIINDCIIPSANPEIDERHRGRQFEIAFDIPSNSYKLRDLGIGFGCFYKLDFPLVNDAISRSVNP